MRIQAKIKENIRIQFVCVFSNLIVSVFSENLIEEVSCQTGATMCHSQAQCVDNEAGYCCICSEGFYGNGRICLPDRKLYFLKQISASETISEV